MSTFQRKVQEISGHVNALKQTVVICQLQSELELVKYLRLSNNSVNSVDSKVNIPKETNQLNLSITSLKNVPTFLFSLWNVNCCERDWYQCPFLTCQKGIGLSFWGTGPILSLWNLFCFWSYSLPSCRHQTGNGASLSPGMPNIHSGPLNTLSCSMQIRGSCSFAKSLLWSDLAVL